MRKWIVMTAAGLLFAAAPVSAQTFGFGAHAGVSLPMGDYGDATSLGFTGGVDLFYPIGPSGLSWVTSASATAHSVDDDNVGGDFDGGFLLFPLMTGARYDIPAGGISAFVQGQLGAVFAKGPESDGVDSDYSTNFGWNVGGGLQFTENVYAGVRYFPLGDVDFEYDSTDV
ncbi:MAG TPA: outer membrane beta-barrel protein, partial [Longimicrobiales bacterium]|nr:outer membrane beta-barrel protein [Longimicrobiales bacterium]